MSNAEGKVTIRPMVLEDLDAMFSIDRRIRAAGEAITYANLTTEGVLTVNRKVGESQRRRPTSYVDLITGDISGLLEYGFVAELDDHVRGFILGDVRHIGEAATEIGWLVIVGVHPDYQRKGIAARLVDALAEKFRSKGIKRMSIGIDQRDKNLLNFIEQMGFTVGHLIDYSKAL